MGLSIYNEMNLIKIAINFANNVKIILIQYKLQAVIEIILLSSFQKSGVFFAGNNIGKNLKQNHYF